jgi:hypothetical protein
MKKKTKLTYNATYMAEQVVAILKQLPSVERSGCDSLDGDEIRKQIRETVVKASPTHFNLYEKSVLLQHVLDDVLGFGPISRIFRSSDNITEIRIERPNKILYWENGTKCTSGEIFRDHDHLLKCIASLEKYLTPDDTIVNGTVGTCVLSKETDDQGGTIYTITREP